MPRPACSRTRRRTSAGDTRSAPMYSTSRASRTCGPATRPGTRRLCWTGRSTRSWKRASSRACKLTAMNRQEGSPPGDENALIAERRAKLARLREVGVAFPNDFRRDALAADLHATYAEKTDEWLAANPVRVRVAGRMMFKRVMGKASFAKL